MAVLNVKHHCLQALPHFWHHADSSLQFDKAFTEEEPPILICVNFTQFWYIWIRQTVKCHKGGHPNKAKTELFTPINTISTVRKQDACPFKGSHPNYFHIYLNFILFKEKLAGFKIIFPTCHTFHVKKNLLQPVNMNQSFISNFHLTQNSLINKKQEKENSESLWHITTWMVWQERYF